MPTDPIVLEGEAQLHSREWQLSLTIDGVAITEVFEQDLGLKAEIAIGNHRSVAKTRKVRVTIETLEE